MRSDFNFEDEGEELLWEFIDGRSSLQDRTAIEKLLATDPAWKAKYRELLEVQLLMQSSELEEPSMRFTKNVMEEIAKMHIAPAAKTYINKNVIKGISIAFMLMIGVFLVYGIVQTDWNATGNSIFPEQVTIGASKVDFSKVFNNTYMNIFLMINVVLGLFLLDRYLAVKKEKYKKS